MFVLKLFHLSLSLLTGVINLSSLLFHYLLVFLTHIWLVGFHQSLSHSTSSRFFCLFTLISIMLWGLYAFDSYSDVQFHLSFSKPVGIVLSVIILWMSSSPALADGLSLEFEWQQVSSSLQDSSQHSSRSNNAVDWMVFTCPLISKSYSFFYQAFGDCSKCTNYKWYHRHLLVSIVSQFSDKV